MATLKLDELKVFHAVAQSRSFTAAAQLLGQDKSQVSRVVKNLERALRSTLLVRTTRKVELTPEGDALFRRCAPALGALEAALRDTPDRSEVPTGQVSLTTTAELARLVVAPAIAGFRARYPGVQLSLRVGRELDTSADLALRVGHPGGKEVVARMVAELTAGFFASPGYLARRPPLDRPDQLGEHDRLWPAEQRGRRSFAFGGSATAEPTIRCDDFSVLAALAVSGSGVALLPTFLVAREVSEGSLVRVLPGLSLGGAPLFLVSGAVRSLPPRVTALREYLLAAIPR